MTRKEPPSPPPATEIEVRGARTHNLAQVDLDLPLGRLTVLTGPSGSGKSSMAMGTLHAEAERRLALVRELGVGAALWGGPDVDTIAHLPPTIGVAQGDAVAAPPRTTVADATGLGALLASVWARESTLRCPACATPMPVVTARDIVDALLAFPEGSRLTVLAPIARDRRGSPRPLLDEIARQGFVRVRLDGVLRRLDERYPVDGREAHDLDVVVDRVKIAPGRRPRVLEAVEAALAAGSGRMLVEVVAPTAAATELAFADHPWCPDHPHPWPVPTARTFDPRLPEGACPTCGGTDPSCDDCAGTGLGPLARSATLGEHRLGPLRAAALQALAAALPSPVDPTGTALRVELARRTRALTALQLGHLGLDRPLHHTSSGERRRLRLARATAVPLAGVLYVLDEPDAGLFGEDQGPIVALARGLVQAGASVVAVSHAEGLVGAADHIVEFGPGAGPDGGEVIYQGDLAGLRDADTPTGAFLRGDVAPAMPVPRPDRGELVVGDRALKLGALTAVVGPSGCGKTRWVAGPVVDAVRAHDTLELIELDQRALGGGSRSCVATTTGVWTELRKALAETREARLRGFDPSRFSFNTPGGRCEHCQGVGTVALDGAWAADHEAPCPTCGGRRFEPGTASVRIKGMSVVQILDATVGEVLPVFQSWPRIAAPLSALVKVGLAHLGLGRRTDSLSGGEARRLRLALELARGDRPSRRRPTGGPLGDRVFVLDEPTIGLHPVDAVAVTGVLQRLCDRGASVVVASNDPVLHAGADHVIDLG